MTLKPIKNSVLCRRIVESKTTEDDGKGLIVRHGNVDVFKVVDFHADEPEKCCFGVGDEIIVNSTGDELVIDGETYYLFKVENVMARVL